jgi:hypothetical protein
MICRAATLDDVALTIERIALLRRVELFAGTADHALAGIAGVLEEVTCPAAAVIMEAGAVEDWLFVVEHGEVEVIRPDRRVINATYQALAPAERLAAQTSVEAAGEPAAIAAVGGLVLIFASLGLGIIWLAVAAAVLGLLWLAIAALCHREYGRRLRDSLARRDWDPTALLVTDAASRAPAATGRWPIAVGHCATQL